LIVFSTLTIKFLLFFVASRAQKIALSFVGAKHSAAVVPTYLEVAPGLLRIFGNPAIHGLDPWLCAARSLWFCLERKLFSLIHRHTLLYKNDGQDIAGLTRNRKPAFIETFYRQFLVRTIPRASHMPIFDR
jgi:hypothetical protein